MESTENNYGPQPQKTSTPYQSPIIHRNKLDGKILVGIIVIMIGVAFLLETLFPRLVPSWLFSWKTLLIAGGFLIGANKDFRGNLWWIMALIGGVFLVDDIIYSMSFLKPLLFPIIIIIVGVLIISRSRKNRLKNWTPPVQQGSDYMGPLEKLNTSTATEQPLLEGMPGGATKSDDKEQSFQKHYQQQEVNFLEDFIQINSFLSNNKRVVNSKNFKGGNATTILGSLELDLVNADFEGIIVLDLFTALGGMEIALPSNWAVRNEVACVMGGIEDKRRYLNQENAHKTLVLKGTVLMGVVEIKSY